MTAPTLPGTDLDTEIADAVNAAFDELDCSSSRKAEIPCGGEKRGYQEYHDCKRGWLCAVHWHLAVEVIYPQWQKMVEETGTIACASCLNRFYDIKKFVRFTPL